ncbi:MAG: GNAT family N-acetyltransferase, partial [Thermoleophilaceae bacterium]
MTTSPTASATVTVRPLAETDLAGADRIFRLAFGTFLGMPQPEMFGGDADYIATRWRAEPEAALAAVRDGELVGSNFVTHWGSVGFFGPLTVRPDLWDRGIAKALMGPTLALLDERGVRLAGLFTFAHSPKH